MKPEDFEAMDNLAVAFYALVLSESLCSVIVGCYSSRVPKEVQDYAQVLVAYFRAQLPDVGFMVRPSDWES